MAWLPQQHRSGWLLLLGSGAQPLKLSPEACDRFTAFSGDDFELLSATLAASNEHSLRLSRLPLQQLGMRSEIKLVKSGQVAAASDLRREVVVDGVHSQCHSGNYVSFRVVLALRWP